jgi:hypothetical protein
MSTFGETILNRRHALFGFPTVDTIRKYTQQFASGAGLDGLVFDGSRSSVRAIASNLINDASDGRWGTAYDAKYLQSIVSILPGGRVQGLIGGDSVVSQEILDLMRQDPAELVRYK